MSYIDWTILVVVLAAIMLYGVIKAGKNNLCMRAHTVSIVKHKLAATWDF